jgi:ubiquinone/menaquinone biosynthesis C-methylase UbiE
MEVYDPLLLGDGRARVCARATGQTLEIAIGTGLNLPFYPRDVQLTGVDLSPAMLAVAGRRARDLGREVDLRLGDALALDFSNDHFDTVVATLFLSSAPDDRQAAAEAWRVLRPGGQLLLLDHARSPITPVRWGERLLYPPMVRLTGSHLLRDPLDYLGAIGFTIERHDRSKWGIVTEIVARKANGATSVPR